jgi:predicted RNA-binding protein YlxR (DUF448 family)
MVRVVRLGDGSLASGRALPGRGAWLCGESTTCVDLAEKRNAFERALRGPIRVGAVDDVRRVLGGLAVAPGREGSESTAL